MVAAGVSDEMLVQISYAIGVAKPLSIFVNTYGTSKVGKSDGEIADAIGKCFDLRPAVIIEKFSLKNPIYSATAAYGHFGRDPFVKEMELVRDGKRVKKNVQFFGWEKLDAIERCKGLFNI
jgi:S-adenosylmethionine synthetase